VREKHQAGIMQVRVFAVSWSCARNQVFEWGQVFKWRLWGKGGVLLLADRVCAVLCNLLTHVHTKQVSQGSCVPLKRDYLGP
jgi:hypothetical protein